MAPEKVLGLRGDDEAVFPIRVLSGIEDFVVQECGGLLIQEDSFRSGRFLTSVAAHRNQRTRRRLARSIECMSDAEGIGGLGRRYHGRSVQRLVPIDFLAGRLTAAMPLGTRAQQVEPESIAHGPEPLERTSAAVLNTGDEQLVVIAKEDCEYCTEDFVSDSHAIMRCWDPPVSISTVRGQAGVESVVGIHGQPVDPTDFVRIATAYVRQPDTTIQTLNFFVSPNATHDFDGVRLLVLGVLATLTPGPRRLDTSAGVRELAEPDDPFELRMAVPPGWVATLLTGPDFLVYQLHRMSPFNGTTTAFNFYVGEYPRTLPTPQPDGPVMPLFGEPRTWVQRRENPPDRGEKRDLIVALPNGRGLVHAMALTNEPALWPELESIAASVTAPNPLLELRTRAEDGDVESMEELGRRRLAADDPVEAEEWLQRAAEHGSPTAMSDLAELLGAHERFAEATGWMEAAAACGCEGASARLGVLYWKAGDNAEAERWLCPTLEQADTSAQFRVGQMAEDHGRHAEARIWYTRAADGGNPNAMLRLAVLLRKSGARARPIELATEAVDRGLDKAFAFLGQLYIETDRASEGEELFRRGASHGDPDSMFHLAGYWMKQASSRGHPQARQLWQAWPTHTHDDIGR